MCKWLQDEICVNGDCPAVADFCPVVNHPGVCRYEEMGKNKIECRHGERDILGLDEQDIKYLRDMVSAESDGEIKLEQEVE